jgi:hypothetical protein
MIDCGYEFILNDKTAKALIIYFGFIDLRFPSIFQLYPKMDRGESKN